MGRFENAGTPAALLDELVSMVRFEGDYPRPVLDVDVLADLQATPVALRIATLELLVDLFVSKAPSVLDAARSFGSVGFPSRLTPEHELVLHTLTSGVEATPELLQRLARAVRTTLAAALESRPMTVALADAAESSPDAARQPDVAAAISETVEAFRARHGSFLEREQVRLRMAITDERRPPLDVGEPWAAALVETMRGASADVARAWLLFMRLCLEDSAKSKPSRAWKAGLTRVIETVGREAFFDRVVGCFALAAKGRSHARETNDVTHPLVLDLVSKDVLRGMCWAAGEAKDPRLLKPLTGVALAMCKKAPGVGPRGAKVANAAVNAIAATPGFESCVHLSTLNQRLTNQSVLKLVERGLDAAAAREGLPREDVEELAAPGYGMRSVGRLDVALGDCRAVMLIGERGASATNVSVEWYGARGKRVKSAPAGAKRDHADDVKELKATVSDARKALPPRRDRLDRLMASRRVWSFAAWRERYLDQPLMGVLARRLIWTFDDGRTRRSGAWLADDPTGPPHGTGRLVRSDRSPLTFDESATTVSLWRPLDGASAAANAGAGVLRDDADAWREFVVRNRIRQPFKQAHRETYLPTEEERRTATYSARFGGKAVRQLQFNALCEKLGWRFWPHLVYDSGGTPPMREFPDFSLRAELWVFGIEDLTGDAHVSGAFRHLTTDHVRFYPIDADLKEAYGVEGGYGAHHVDEPRNQPIPIDEVPAIVFSETMRDVDLLVGVSSEGDDPWWRDRGGSTYDWRRGGASSISVEERRRVLTQLLPMVPFGDACSLVADTLVVLGRRRPYKVDLESGAVRRAEDDTPLAIEVQARGEFDHLLPFEGDAALSRLLELAALLSQDDRTTDPKLRAALLGESA